MSCPLILTRPRCSRLPAPAGSACLDGGVEDYAVHTGLHWLYVTHADNPAEWAKKLSVIQDAGPPAPPSDWEYLPVVM